MPVPQNAETPLLLAAKGRNYVVQELLLGRGADADRADQAGVTALHHEAGHGDHEAVRLLLAHGADPNPADVVSHLSPPLLSSPLHSHRVTAHSFCLSQRCIHASLSTLPFKAAQFCSAKSHTNAFSPKEEEEEEKKKEKKRFHSQRCIVTSCV